MASTPAQGDSGGVGPVEPGAGERNPADSEMKDVTGQSGPAADAPAGKATAGPEAPLKEGKPSKDSSPADDPENQDEQPEGRPGGSGLTPDEEKTLAELQAKRDTSRAGRAMVDMKVLPPHSHVIYGGVTVGDEWTPVPAGMAANVASAAADAGVQVTQKDQDEES